MMFNILRKRLQCRTFPTPAGTRLFTSKPDQQGADFPYAFLNTKDLVKAHGRNSADEIKAFGFLIG